MPSERLSIKNLAERLNKEFAPGFYAVKVKSKSKIIYTRVMNQFQYTWFRACVALGGEKSNVESFETVSHSLGSAFNDKDLKQFLKDIKDGGVKNGK